MHDYVVVGAGIVGAATAWELKCRHPEASVLLVDKEEDLSLHQTGRNSGVIHAGVYYAPGSLKAEFCRAGHAATFSFCQQHGIAHRKTGKLLVATNSLEIERAKALVERCQLNGIDHRWVDQEELRDLEPSIRGEAAILVPETGIADYRGINRKLVELFVERGGEVRLGDELVGGAEAPDHVRLSFRSGDLHCRYLVACAGLQSDRVARHFGLAANIRIVPFRGEYFQLGDRWSGKFNHLIYPIPDPDLPFLGVHITLMVDGSITVGPNAVLGFAREDYGRLSFDGRDFLDTTLFPGFWRAMRPYLVSGIKEMRNSLSRRYYLEACRRYCPEISLEDLKPYPAGIRAQLIWKDGRMEHDFLIASSRRTLHVCNAPSPAATSALPIARHIVSEIEAKLFDS